MQYSFKVTETAEMKKYPVREKKLDLSFILPSKDTGSCTAPVASGTAVLVHMAVQPLTLNAFLSAPLWESGRAEHMLHDCTAATDNQKDIFQPLYCSYTVHRKLRCRSGFAAVNKRIERVDRFFCIKQIISLFRYFRYKFEQEADGLHKRNIGPRVPSLHLMTVWKLTCSNCTNVLTLHLEDFSYLAEQYLMLIIVQLGSHAESGWRI